MNSTVTELSDVKKSRIKLPTKKQAAKAVALTVFGAAVALVAYDKVTHRGDSETSETETD